MTLPFEKFFDCSFDVFVASQLTFDEAGLSPKGSFKAAEAHYTDVDQIDTKDLQRRLEKSQKIQWNYKNIVKSKGELKRLV